MTRFDHTRQKTARARRLRQEATPSERILWSKLRLPQMRGETFRRQHPVGAYVLDFCCPALRLAIEIDGGQHGFDSVLERDMRRDTWLARYGIRTLRFWNADVRGNLNGVLDAIRLAAAEAGKRVTPIRSALPTDLPLSGGGKDTPAEE